MILRFFLWLLFFMLFRSFVLAFAGISGVTLWGIGQALIADTCWALFFSLVFNWLRGKKWRLVAHGLYVLLLLFLIVAFGFAKLYQRPLSLHFIRTDTGTIWKENFVSGLYELSWPHLVLAVLLSLIYLVQWRFAPVARSCYLAVGFTAVLALISLSYFATGEQQLVANPLSAFWARRAAGSTMIPQQIGSGDLIPSLRSVELVRALPEVKVNRVEGRNVILYYLESTPFSVIGKKINGKEITPYLNRLSERSLVFKRHYANFPLSINAFYNSFCSAYALPDGAWISLVLPDFKVPCLSQVLAGEGYRAAVLHAGYLGYAKQKRFLERRGFSLMLDAETLKKPPYEKGMGPWGAADERAMIRPLTEFAKKDKAPFLALLFAFAPHHPYNVPEGFPEVFTGQADIKKSQARYFNSLHFADAAFGEIFAALEKNGVLKNSLLIVFGDHGEAFYEHPGNYNHPFYLYEENIHVPLFIWYDGVEPQQVNRVTSHVDILPTVLDLLGKASLRSPLHVGESMLRGGPQSIAHIQTYWQEEFSGIVDERYKYIRKETGAQELFDLWQDPGERQNLAEILPELTARYQLLTMKTFAQKKAYYEIHGAYQLTRFNPASQDR